MVSNIERREKCYVEVIADFGVDGTVTPLVIVWEDGTRFPIESVSECRRAASMKVGGYGTRYTVHIGGKVRYLWKDANGWYVEAIVNDGITAM